MKDKCCCCEQRERFIDKVYIVLGFWVAISLLLVIPIWIWATIIVLWVMCNFPRTTIAIIAIIFASLIGVTLYKISALNDEAEYWNKQRERLEAAWPLEQNITKKN
jgi:hypothetical protein